MFLVFKPLITGDVYGYGIIISQVILRCEPFHTPESDHIHTTGYGGTDKEIVLEVRLFLTFSHNRLHTRMAQVKTTVSSQVKQGSIAPLRPHVPRAACSPELYQLMERCWSEYPIERPSFVMIMEVVRKIAGKASDNIIDHLLRRMEQYANSLEEQVNEKTELVWYSDLQYWDYLIQSFSRLAVYGRETKIGRAAKPVVAPVRDGFDDVVFLKLECC